MTERQNDRTTERQNDRTQKLIENNMQNSNRNSYEESEVADINSIIAEGSESPEEAVPVKELSEDFDNCAKEGGDATINATKQSLTLPLTLTLDPNPNR
jgi:hypothetical protein